MVDPDKQSTSGNYVIALPPQRKEIIFRQYIVEGGLKYLKPLNTQYPVIEMKRMTIICGVVIGCLRGLVEF